MTIRTNERLYDTAEAAAYLGLQPDTVRKHVQRENLTPFQVLGQAYLFTESMLADFKATKRKRGNPQFSR